MKQLFSKQETGFTQVKNTVLVDKELSLKGKGLYSYLFSKPENWDFAFDRIAKELGIGEKSVRTGLLELETVGYLERLKQASGKVKYYLNHDKKPSVQKGHLAEKPGAYKGKEPKRLVAKRDTISNKEDTSNTEGESNSKSAEAREVLRCFFDGCEKEVKDTEMCEEHDRRIMMVEVREIIDAFAPVNESYLTLYGKKTEHGAVKNLIKTYPKEHILGILKVLPDYNKLQYLSSSEKVYTPYQLLKNWSVVKDNLIRVKAKMSKEKTKQEILT